MPNQPRVTNPARPIRVEDELWRAAGAACAILGTTRSEVMREALRRAVDTTKPGGAGFVTYAHHRPSR